MSIKDFSVGVVGNPNCGKTTLFNVLAGAKQRVGNWPGVTVDRKVGEYQHAGEQIELVDLPGIYSLDAVPGQAGIDESIAQQYILSGEADLIINVIDASNLERNLYLSMQLLEIDVPMLLVLNMMDVVAERGDKIDLEILSKSLGCEIVAVTASNKQGITELKDKINALAKSIRTPRVRMPYPQQIEHALEQLEPPLKTILSSEQQIHSRWLALRLLEDGEEGNTAFTDELVQQALSLKYQIESELEEDLDILIADSRYRLITAVVEQALHRAQQLSRSLSEKIDNIVLNRWLGIPIFLGVMYLMFMFSINIGGVFIDFFDLAAAALIVDGSAYLLQGLNTPELIVTLVTQGLGGGVQVVATFIPVIVFLFLFLSILEDSGYMARAAFVMDRFMRFIGLPGKSFVPMIVGFGCNVPAIMATRTLENQRDRYMTVLMNPFMSCGARLPVYALFAAAFFPSNGQNLVFGLYVIGILVAIFTGLVMKYSLLRGEASHFVMELPPYHTPSWRSVALNTWDRLSGFILRAGKVIVPMVLLISFLNSWGTDGTFGNDNTNKSVLSEVGRTLTPVFEPMGIQEDNWPATVGIFTGILAKEVVVGTLDSIYGQLGEDSQPATDAPEEYNLGARLSEAVQTIPANFAGLADLLLDPLGLSGAADAKANAEAVTSTAFSAMGERFDGQLGAFAYVLFILLYAPCVAATAAVYRETGPNWARFVVFWSTTVAYMSAVLCYQIGTYAQHPTQSLSWVVGIMLTFLALFMLLRYLGQRQNPKKTSPNNPATCAN